MLNKNEDVINAIDILASFAHDAGQYDDGWNCVADKLSDTTSLVRQRIDYMQAQIDALMLEFCPEEMSQEQLDNWAKHQKPVDG